KFKLLVNKDAAVVEILLREPVRHSGFDATEIIELQRMRQCEAKEIVLPKILNVRRLYEKSKLLWNSGILSSGNR
ncbi:hypothetical protein HAX54_000199, partial [Datura stramonium]|nr:hypothetical protein [Datura stramonium]